MRLLLQRVRHGKVTVAGKTCAEIGNGLIIFVGIGPEDGEDQVAALARKVSNLRIFEDDQGKMNLSITAIGGEAIVVSQFTLYADTRKGNRPSFTAAAPPDFASKLVDNFAEQLQKQGVAVQTGMFGAHMVVSIENNGPVTIWLEV